MGPTVFESGQVQQRVSEIARQRLLDAESLAGLPGSLIEESFSEFDSELEAARRLLSLAQRIKYSLIPGALYSRARSRRQLRRGEEELRLLPQLVDGRRTAIDVGANKGTYAWPLSQLCSHVYAYEPNPAMRWILRKLMPFNVTIRDRAIGDRCGHDILRVPRKSGRYSNNVSTLRQSHLDNDCLAISVRTTTLDEENVRNVGFIKIDVEGLELEVIRGAARLIARDRPVLLVEILTEYTGRPVLETVKLIEQFGYVGQLVSRGEMVAINSETVDLGRETPEADRPSRNVLFLPRNDR